MEWFEGKAIFGLARWVIALIGAVAVCLLAWWLIASLFGGKNAETEAKLNGNRANAITQSASEAVATVSSQASAETQTHEDVHDAQSQVNAAADADAADAAGRNGLHHIRADRR